MANKNKPKDLYAIWKDGGIGQVIKVTTENHRTEYYIHWFAYKGDAEYVMDYPYGPEDIECGDLTIVKGNLRTIKALYGDDKT